MLKALEPKKIATNFESARRYKEASKFPPKSEEASLFGEQDYENQQEVSFFGPPLQQADIQKKDQLESETGISICSSYKSQAVIPTNHSF